MSLASVRAFFEDRAPDVEIIVSATSSATVPLAAVTHGVRPGQIAKTLSLRLPDGPALLVVPGDARLDNRKAKAAFGAKVRFVAAEEVEDLTGHPVGGVCPFGLKGALPVYCDVGLRRFAQVIPAAGSPNSAVKISPERMAVLVGARWVDACAIPEEGAAAACAGGSESP